VKNKKSMLFPISKTPNWVIFLIDILISIFSLFLAYFIRFEFQIKTIQGILAYKPIFSILIFLLVKLFVFYIFKIYQGHIRHTSILDVKRILFSIGTSTLIFFLLNFVRARFIDSIYLLPTSIIIMEFFISYSLIIGFRFSVKIFYIESFNKINVTAKEKVLIYGAGVSGLITKRTIEKDSESPFEVIGYIDDNLKLKNTRLQGTKIFSSNDIEKVIQLKNVNKLIVAIQKPNYDKQKFILDACLKHSVSVLQVPSSKSWINGDFTTSQIKNIKIEDLLGRNPIYLQPEKIQDELKNQIVLVSGAAGSIGSGIVKQLVLYNPKQVILLDQAESALYDLEQDLIFNYPGFNFSIVVGDICNYKRMERLYDYFKPDFVFHAAAYKHVPLMEDNPSEAIYTNVLGTKNLVDLSLEFEVKKFVMVSTDKAVNPTNVMGASKRIAEIYAQSNVFSKTKFITTRFGNVLGSNGSVIPLFKKQIEQGGPITITDKRVTRFFMTIPEACQLVLEACTMGNGGEIFVFDMGESVKIIDLARKMIKLSGLVEGKDIEIKVTGLRPGEKLYEELLAKDENTIATHHPKILIAKVRESDNLIKNKIEELISLYNLQNNQNIVKLMKEIVPEYKSNNSEFSTLD
jgi:FlaA1/EpsC-like NDP-sugar epimerase